MFTIRRRWTWTAAVAVAVVAMGGSSIASARTDSAHARQDLVKLKISYGNQTIDFVQLAVAVKAGIFAKNGLDVSLVNGTGGLGPAFLIAGQADIAVSDGPTFMTANTKGANLNLLSVNLNRFTFKLVGSKSVANVKGLAGKTLALSSPGASVDVAGRAMLANFGMSPRDVKIVYISNVAARLAALSSGSVDAMIASPPVSPVLQNGKLHVIYDLIGLRNITISSWSTGSWAKANVDTIKRYIRSDIKAIAWMQSPAHKAAVKQIVADFTGFTDSASVDEGYEVLLKEFQPEPLPDLKSLANSIATVKGKTGVTLDRDSFLFLSPLEQVLTYRLRSNLSAMQQVPRPKNSAGRATFSGTLSPSGTLRWNLAASKLTGSVTRIELRLGKPGRVGPAKLRICAPCTRSGSGAVNDHALRRQIKTGGAYLVVATKKNPNGELRGQLTAKLG